MRRILSGLLVVLALPVVGGQEAQASPPPEGLSRVVGAPSATCTPRGCRYEVACESTGEGCIFTLSLYWRGYLTKIPTCIVDPEDPVKCLPEAKGVYLKSGQTKTLKLGVLGLRRHEIEDRLKRGDRTLKGGWEAFRLDYLGPVNEDEEADWDAIPGFFTYPVLGGWLVFQLDQDTKIKLKRRF